MVPNGSEGKTMNLGLFLFQLFHFKQYLSKPENETHITLFGEVRWDTKRIKFLSSLLFDKHRFASRVIVSLNREKIHQ